MPHQTKCDDGRNGRVRIATRWKDRKKSFQPMIKKSAIAEKLSERLPCDVSFAAQ